MYMWYILIGLVAGWLCSLIVKGSGYSLFLNLVIGVICSVLGGWLFSLIGFGTTNSLGSLITAIVCAVLMILIVILFEDN